MQKITSGTYREIWREVILLDGGATTVVTTGLRAAPGAVSQVFGVLELRSVTGLPTITATPSSVNGRLVVTITNSAAVGNAAAWQLDVILHHSITQGRNAAGEGAIYVIGPNGQAEWPLNQIRYFFIDGDNGDDGHVGYLDAAPGTVFTPAQAAAVAVKTTNRLEGLVSRFGAGRGYVILAKPRAGLAIYDAAVPGDAIGGFRRDLHFGYSLEIMRGSDLTNSAEDRAQLGMVTAYGPFTVATVGADADGPYITCTAPIGLLPEDMSHYRLRSSVGGNTYYATIEWGDNPVAPAPADPTMIRVWQPSWGPIAPGDTVYLERPGTRLHSYTEAVVEAVQPADGIQTARLVLSGVEIGADDTGLIGDVYIGANVGGGGMNHAGSYDTPSPPMYYCVRSYNTPPRIVGSVFATYYWADETGNQVLPAFGYGLDINGCITTQQIDSIDINFSRLDNSIVITAKKIAIQYSFVLLLATIGGAEGMTLSNILYSKVMAQPRANFRLQDSRWISEIYQTPNDGVHVLADQGSNFGVYFSGLSSFFGAEPDRQGITLTYGQYTTTLAIDSVTLGNGIMLVTNVLGNNTNIPLTYTSLAITGFELEGEQKIVVESVNTHYPSMVSPCPRGVIMRMVDGVAGTAYPAGLVVSAPAATPDRFDLALSDGAANMRVVGVLLSNVVQAAAGFPGGYAVVGYDGIMVLRQEAGSAAPVSGDELYLSAANAGYATIVAPGGTYMRLARAVPIGPNAVGGGDPIPAAWDPELPHLPV